MNQIQKFSTVVKKQEKKQTVGVTVWPIETHSRHRGGQEEKEKKKKNQKQNKTKSVKILFLWFWASCLFFQDMTS